MTYRIHSVKAWCDVSACVSSSQTSGSLGITWGTWASFSEWMAQWVYGEAGEFPFLTGCQLRLVVLVLQLALQTTGQYDRPISTFSLIKHLPDCGWSELKPNLSKTWRKHIKRKILPTFVAQWKYIICAYYWISACWMRYIPDANRMRSGEDAYSYPNFPSTLH